MRRASQAEKHQPEGDATEASVAVEASQLCFHSASDAFSAAVLLRGPRKSAKSASAPAAIRGPETLSCQQKNSKM